jgi:hypothetical protein
MAKKNASKPAPVKTTIKISEKVAEAIAIIKETQPHVKVAYFNQAGEYHFHKRPGFVSVPIQDDEDTDLEVDIDDVDEDEDTQVDAGGKKLEF